MKKTVIEFIGSASPYHAGDIAGFDEAAAKVYIDAKVAKLHKPAPTGKVAGGGGQRKPSDPPPAHLGGTDGAGTGDSAGSAGGEPGDKA